MAETVKTKSDPPGVGWFHIPGVQSGQRYLAQQVKGLDVLQRYAEGKAVLDLGCAEGLVSEWLCEAGASHADGLDYNCSRIAVGRGLVSDRVHLHVADLNDLSTLPPLLPSYDIVLLLAILQKLKRPEKLLDYALARCGYLLAIQVPAQVVNDARSEHRLLDIAARVSGAGFVMLQESIWPVWLAIFVRGISS